MKQRLGNHIKFLSVLAVSLIVAVLMSGFGTVKVFAEETTTQLKRIINHNPGNELYISTNNQVDAPPALTRDKTKGLDYAIWLEEDTGKTTDKGNKIVRLKNYGTGEYVSVINERLLLQSKTNGQETEWEIEIKNDYPSWHGQGENNFPWNRYKTLNSKGNKYLTAQGLGSGEGNLNLTEISDDWWSAQWAYEAVNEDEVITKPGELAIESDKKRLLEEINKTKLSITETEKYQTVSV